MSELHVAERPASGPPQGLLVLHHGRGADELDLLGLGDVLDPERRLHVAAPRAPLILPGSPGYHWYRVPRVGHPDPESFTAAYAALTACHDRLWAQTGIPAERTVLAGFSMGAVMSYATSLASERPTPAGLLAFSGFVPTVEGWIADLGSRPRLPVFIAHGRHDPVISVEFARRARLALAEAGLPVAYHEGDGAHAIDPAHARAALGWLGELI